jgi:PncC family amidohydrolase
MTKTKPSPSHIGELLRAKNWKLALAESCTGGLIADLITDVPGSSDYFIGGVVAYAYSAKADLLGVSWETLNTVGAVSRETVIEMARGARQALGADVAISVSGIAGPGGGTPDKPVGTTWVGLSAPNYDDARMFVWNGDRKQNKSSSAHAALQMLLQFLQQ